MLRASRAEEVKRLEADAEHASAAALKLQSELDALRAEATEKLEFTDLNRYLWKSIQIHDSAEFMEIPASWIPCMCMDP